jgi:hypothetical protein
LARRITASPRWLRAMSTAMPGYRPRASRICLGMVTRPLSVGLFGMWPTVLYSDSQGNTRSDSRQDMRSLASLEKTNSAVCTRTGNEMMSQTPVPTPCFHRKQKAHARNRAFRLGLWC